MEEQYNSSNRINLNDICNSSKLNLEMPRQSENYQNWNKRKSRHLGKMKPNFKEMAHIPPEFYEVERSLSKSRERAGKKSRSKSHNRYSNKHNQSENKPPLKQPVTSQTQVGPSVVSQNSSIEALLHVSFNIGQLQQEKEHNLKLAMEKNLNDKKG